MSVRITEEPFDPETETARFRAAVGGAGAVVSFTGIVRGEDDVSALTLSHFPGFTEKQIATIVEQAKADHDIIAAEIIHRVGRMEPGEVIVWVATASAHRRAAFEACDRIMDYLKSEAPFWKQEERDGASAWIEPRSDDLKDKERWSHGGD